jgi:hypothetical protein
MKTAVALIAYAGTHRVEVALAEGKVRLSGVPKNVAHVADSLKQHRDVLLRWLQQELAEETQLAPDLHQVSKRYYAHHFACPTCISAGKLGGLRCYTGLDLWGSYLQSIN